MGSVVVPVRNWPRACHAGVGDYRLLSHAPFPKSALASCISYGGAFCGLSNGTCN